MNKKIEKRLIKIEEGRLDNDEMNEIMGGAVFMLSSDQTVTNLNNQSGCECTYINKVVQGATNINKAYPCQCTCKTLVIYTAQIMSAKTSYNSYNSLSVNI
ncbi:MAG: hypothetical protein LBG80_03425 [Bacteroidales bacterium]|jgi:hypothetical protein|nr:hypothetical protein [Bacteroidales bacterium]